MEVECQNAKMPFKGAIYAIGKHVNHYAKIDSPSHDKSDFMPGLTWMSQSLCHMFSHHFHWETITMKRTLQSFDKMSPVCMGG